MGSCIVTPGMAVYEPVPVMGGGIYMNDPMYINGGPMYMGGGPMYGPGFVQEEVIINNNYGMGGGFVQQDILVQDNFGGGGVMIY
jgi:hypothetical protein